MNAMVGPAGIDKRSLMERAVGRLKSGMTILVGGFGERGFPFDLVDVVLESGIDELTVVKSDGNEDGIGIGKLIEAGRVRKIIASHVGLNCGLVDKINQRRIEAKICPQGILAERIRAGGAGLGGILSDIGVETLVAEGKERVTIEGRTWLIEKAIRGDAALLRVHRADHFGNATYRNAARNFNPLMAMAADYVIVEAEEIVTTGTLEPNAVMTPGVFVDAVVSVGEGGHD